MNRIWLILRLKKLKIIMKLMNIFLCCVVMSLALVSCKDDPKNKEVTGEDTVVKDSEETQKTEVTGAQIVLANSVMAKLMATPEAKAYVSHAISAGVIDLLSKEEGPFTLFVPTNEAFAALPKLTLDDLSHVSNKPALVTLIKNHIFEGDLSSADLLQSVKKNSAYTLKTMGGANIMVYLEGANIMLKDSNGVIGKVGKSDILASNGKVHIIDAVLTAAR
jgi:uncharacterized surface protein with fasciclin (FAS1) repeats